jgi:hypothetical protein
MRLLLAILALLLLGADYSGRWRTTDGQSGRMTCKLTKQGDKWVGVFVNLNSGQRYVIRFTGPLPRLTARRAVVGGSEYDFDAGLTPDGTFTATWRGRYPGQFKMKEDE